MPEKRGKISAVALFAITIITIAVMWQPAFWATAFAEAGIFVLAAVWLALFSVRPELLRFKVVLVPLVAAALWPVMQLAVGATIYRWSTSVAILYWATNAAVVFVGIQTFADAGVRRGYLRALVVAGFVIAVIAPLQLFTADGKIFWLFEVKYSDVAMGPFIYANQYAAFIELLLPIALTGIFSDRAGWRTFHALAVAVMYASILASASRSGFVLTSAEVLMVPLLTARRTGITGRQLVAPGAVFLGMLVILALAVGPDRLVAKFAQKDPYRGRREYVESSLRMIRDKPMLGVGMGNWSAAYPSYATFDEGSFANQAHNDWAQWAVEGGVPFALLMLSVVVWSFPRALRSGWGFGVIVVFLHCLVDYPIQRMGVTIVFFSVVAAISYPGGYEESEPVLRGGRRHSVDRRAAPV